VAKCEHIKEPCYLEWAKVCNEEAELCRRRKLLKRGMTQEQIDKLVKQRVIWRVKINAKEKAKEA